MHLIPWVKLPLVVAGVCCALLLAAATAFGTAWRDAETARWTPVASSVSLTSVDYSVGPSLVSGDQQGGAGSNQGGNNQGGNGGNQGGNGGGGIQPGEASVTPELPSGLLVLVGLVPLLVLVAWRRRRSGHSSR